MIIEYNYGPRQIGKTTEALEYWALSPSDTAIFFTNNDMCKYAKRLARTMGSEDKEFRFFSANSMGGLRAYRHRVAILDDFDFFSNKVRFIHGLIPTIEPGGKIIIYTTPRYVRDKKIFAMVKLCKKLYNTFQSIPLESICPGITKQEKDDFEKIWDDIITHDNVQLNQMQRPTWSKIPSDIRYMLPPTQYDSEILGMMFK